jgi:hypothetical protein
MLGTLVVMSTDSRQPDTLEKCLLWQGFQHDIAAGDRVVLTGPTSPKEAIKWAAGEAEKVYQA